MLRAVSCCVAGALALAYLAAGGLMLWDDLREAGLLHLAAKIEGSEGLPKISSQLRERLSLLLSEATDGRERSRRARVTNALFLLRLEEAEQPGTPAWQARLSQTRRVVYESLRYSPLDGNLWLVAADLERLAGFDRALFRTFIDRSIALAPFEGPILDRRWTMLTPLAKTFDVQKDAELRADLASAFVYSRPQNLARLMVELSQNHLEALVADLFSSLGAARRESIRHADAALRRTNGRH